MIQLNPFYYTPCNRYAARPNTTECTVKPYVVGHPPSAILMIWPSDGTRLPTKVDTTWSTSLYVYGDEITKNSRANTTACFTLGVSIYLIGIVLLYVRHEPPHRAQQQVKQNIQSGYLAYSYCCKEYHNEQDWTHSHIQRPRKVLELLATNNSF